MSRPLRPLLPADGSSGRGQLVELAPKRKIPYGQACEACRSCKTKCSGERPSCRKCVARLTACRYVESEARQGKRKYEELRKSFFAQDELLGLMATLPEEDAFKLLRRVRNGEKFGAIVNHVKTGDLHLQMQLVPETRLIYTFPYSHAFPARLVASGSPYLKSKVYEASLRHASGAPIGDITVAQPDQRVLPNIDELTYHSEYVKPYHSAVLFDPLLDKAKPSDWSNVIKSKDDASMRDALATYFKHEYHLFPAFQKDLFLEDMASGGREKGRMPCCSALLVNATLAYACFCYSRISNRFRYWDPDNLGYRLLAETKRLWEMQTMKSDELHSLTSIQAAMITNIVYNVMGLDKIGNLYGLQAVAIAKEMHLFNGNAHIASDRVRHARNFTAWCIFNTNVHLSWHYFRPSCFAKPPEFTLPDPSADPKWYGEIWSRYPLSPTLSQLQFAYYFKARCEHLVVLRDVCHDSFSDTSPLSTRQAESFAQRLTDWFTSLPAIFSSANSVLPAHFLMHLDHYICLTTLCQPFIQEQWDNGLSASKLVSDAERDMNILLRLYYLRHGFSGADSWLTSPLAKIAFSSLQSIANHTNPEDLEYARSSLFLALKGLREQGRNFYIARTVYYVVRNQIRPEEARLLLGSEDPELAADDNLGMDGEVQSAWVPRLLSVAATSVADEELSTLAKQYLTLEPGQEHEND